ncbi:MAG: helix-turn-helix domain-containing protein [Chloroherpetonaceae bacterium]|nr:helix-turn-helix domain-containing protein [Ruminococcus flavefaciens]
MREENYQQLYTIDEVASLLKVHPNTIRRWERLGLMKFVRIIDKPRITQQEVDRLIGMADIQESKQDL